VSTKYKKSMGFKISKENINNILMAPEVEILKIGQHMKQKPNTDNSYISFEKQH
jgi:hypothetical protein